MNPYEIIVSPLTTEKSTLKKEKENKYTFWVSPRANKIEIKNAVEELFKVKVLKVRTLKVRGKRRRLGMSEGLTSQRKKAVVSIKKGQNITLFEGV